MKLLPTARVSLRAPLNNETPVGGTVIGRNYGVIVKFRERISRGK
jgi:hypothetical protein